MFFAFASAELAAALGGGAVAGLAVAVGAWALAEGRELAEAIGLDAHVEHAFEEAFAELVGAAGGGVFLDLLGGEPAAGGEVVGGNRFGFVEALAFFHVEALVVAPHGVEDAAFGKPGTFGSEGLAGGSGEDFVDGDFDERCFVEGLHAGGAGEGEGGDLAGVEDFSGAPGVDGFGEESLSDLGGEDLDGGEVFEEGHGDFGAFGADGIAVFGVGDAEVLVAEGALPALASGDGDGAAAAVFRFRGGHDGS